MTESTEYGSIRSLPAAFAGRTTAAPVDYSPGNLDALKSLLNSIPPEHHITIMGQTGSGKTVLERTILRERKRWTVIQFLAEATEAEDWERFAQITVGDAPEYRSALERHYDRIAVVCEPETMEKFLVNGKRVGGWKAYRATWNDVCKMTYYSGNRTLLCDEAGLVCSPKPDDCETWHSVVASNGRKAGVGLICASQRPQDLNKRGAYDLARHYFVYRVGLRAIEGSASYLPAAEVAAQLPPYHFVYMDAVGGMRVFAPVPLDLSLSWGREI